MGQLARIGGGQPVEHNPRVNSGTRVRLPNPDDFDLERDPIPHNPGIPEILEFKLDLIIRGLGRLARPPFININILLGNGLAAIIALLILILGALAVIIGQLGAINFALAGITALLGAILFFILFVVIRIAVPFIRDNARRP